MGNIFLIKGKKGEKLLTIYWFVILVLVAGGIVGMVGAFYKHPYDVREVEADILSNKIVRCFESRNFELDFEENILKKCGIKFENVSGKEIEYYLSVEVYDFEKIDLKGFFKEGNKNLLSSCELKDEFYKNLAKCSQKEFYSLDKEGTGYWIKILGIVGKGEQNVK